jgi:GNAT superfamily N-acetyltransferase
VTVRPATIDEAPAVVAAFEWLFGPPGVRPDDWDPEVAAVRVRATIDGPASTLLVADALTGFCSVHLDLVSIRYGQRAWIEDLAVHPDHRSVGLGKALLDAASEWARGRGATHLELDSGDARTDAHRFYEREGPAATSRCFQYRL